MIALIINGIIMFTHNPSWYSYLLAFCCIFSLIRVPQKIKQFLDEADIIIIIVISNIRLMW